jgi:hypothetical protein
MYEVQYVAGCAAATGLAAKEPLLEVHRAARPLVIVERTADFLITPDTHPAAS